MKQAERAKPLASFKNVVPRPVRLGGETLVEADSLSHGEPFPLVLRPKAEDLNLAAWAQGSRAFIEERLLRHGALLFRGFRLETAAQFEQFVSALAPDLLEYRERAAPRIEVGRRVYTSTEYPAEHHIPLHHEMSYSHNWPTKLWFYCEQPPACGGRTPIADDRKIFRLIDPKIKEVFTRKRVMYVRNYGEGADLSWQEVFGTDDRAAVEEYCRGARTEFEWVGGNRLRTRQVRQAVATHPLTGETVWFNHAHMFHVSNLEPHVRASLLAEFAEDELPRNAFYGDGTPIEASVLDEIRGLYNSSAVAFEWQRGDILMVDNFLASHGREPFTAPRRILVAMAELYTNTEL